MTLNPFKAAVNKGNPFLQSGYREVAVTAPEYNAINPNLKKIGSYRIEKYAASCNMEASVVGKKDSASGESIIKSFATHPSLRNLSVMEARLEDYFSIRTGNMNQQNAMKVTNLRNKGYMNKTIVDNQPTVLPISINRVNHRSMGSSGTGSNPFKLQGSSTPTFAGGQSGSPFAPSQPSNPFAKTNSSNPFSQLSNTKASSDPFAALRTSINSGASNSSPFKIGSSSSNTAFPINSNTSSTGVNIFKNIAQPTVGGNVFSSNAGSNIFNNAKSGTSNVFQGLNSNTNIFNNANTAKNPNPNLSQSQNVNLVSAVNAVNLMGINSQYLDYFQNQHNLDNSALYNEMVFKTQMFSEPGLKLFPVPEAFFK